MIVCPLPGPVAAYDKKSGFTLIEVSLAVLVIGLGLLTVFSLFPSGLRSAEDGAADTHAGLFAESVMNGLHGNAATFTNWADWCDASYFNTCIRTDVLGSGVIPTGMPTAVSFPSTDGRYLRYRLSIQTASSNQYGALIEVCDGQYGSFIRPSVFYTEFVYPGL